MAGDQYSLIENVGDLTDGAKIIIVSSTGSKALGATQNDNNRAAADVTISSDVIEPGEDVQIITLEASSSNWKLCVGEDKYLYAASSSKNNLKTASAETAGTNGVWAISFSGNEAVIKAQGSNTRNLIRYNSSNTLFSCYASGQDAVSIYKYIDAPASVAKPVIEGETSFYDETEVTLSCTTEGAKIYYTLDGTEPSATSTEYLGSAIKINATATVKAIAIKGEDKSSIVEKKFTKAPEFASIEALVAAGLATGTKVTVSFSEVEITNIFENKSGKRQGIYLNVKAENKDVEIYYNSDDVPEAWNIGGVVSGTIQGTWTLYNSQWEIVPASSTWKWTELTYNVPSVIAIIIPTTSYNAPAAGISGTIDVTYNNIADLSSAAVAFYEEDGTTPATYAWLTTSFDEEKNVTYNVAASEEAEARVAYLKVYVGEVYSDLVTIRQAKFVPAYATLPFEFDGGKADIEDTPGLTQAGLGSDYSASPKLKFDGTGDYLILQFNEDAGQLSFDIKGNGFSGGTFTVQTSADGENYTDLKAYTKLDAVETEAIDIKSGVRYIKWIYTEKSSGNVALGNISLEKAKDPTAIDNTAFEAKTFKTFENGQLVIIKNGIKYNATGAVIR